MVCKAASAVDIINNCLLKNWINYDLYFAYFVWILVCIGMNLNSAGVCIFENFQRLNIARGAAERNIQPLEIFKNTHPLPNDRKTWFAGRLVQWILLSRTKFFIASMIHFKADLMGSFM